MKQALKNFHYRGLVLIVSLMLPACANNLSAYFGEPEGYSALEYYRWTASASEEALGQELQRLLSESAANNSLISSVQLALVYSVSTLQTQERLELAMGILGQQRPEAGNRRSSDYFSFAQLWLERLERAQTISRLEAQVAELEQTLQAANALNQELQEQIEALTNIEQQIIEREQLQENNE